MNINLALYDILGERRSSLDFSVPAGAQVDLLIHDFEAREADSNGKICATHDGQPGDLDGNMVQYFRNTGAQALEQDFGFAFAIPMTNGRSGEQYVPFNTFQPSLDPADQENFVANWVTLSNQTETGQTGRLVFYAIDGRVLGTEAVAIPGGARRDFSAHQFGFQMVGLVEWLPDSSEAKFQFSAIRYLHDNPEGAASFDTAFQLEGSVGTGEEIIAPLNTEGSSAILELANASTEATTANVKIFNIEGALLDEKDIFLAAHASFHIVTDSILGGAAGTVLVDGPEGSKLMATVMQYARTETGGIDNIYGLRAKPARGTVMRGGYNTFINQSSDVWLVNNSNEAQEVTLDMKRYDGEEIALGHTVSVPARGLRVVSVNDFESLQAYGVITVNAATPNTISAVILRSRGSDYAMPTPVRQ